MNMMKVLQEYNRTFINWFKETIFSDNSASKTLRLLVVGPNLNVLIWKGYDINNYPLRFTLVDLNKVAYKDEPFIMAEQARQVFYVQDSCDSRYTNVLMRPPIESLLQHHILVYPYLPVSDHDEFQEAQ